MLQVRGRKGKDLNLSDVIRKLIVLTDADMKKSNLVKKTIFEFYEEWNDYRSLVAFVENEVVGYVSYRVWNGMTVEIMTVFVSKFYRKTGIGKYLVNCILHEIRAKHPDKKIIVLPNQKSIGIFQSLGFFQFNIDEVPTPAKAGCKLCVELNRFPNCHCHYFEYLDVNSVEYMQFSDVDKTIYAQQYFRLYRQVWICAPWFENWTNDQVVKEVRSYKKMEDPIFIFVHVHGRVVGFCSGYFLSKKQMQEKCGSDAFDHLFDSKKKIFYLAEVGIMKGFRLKGLGEILMKKLISHAELKSADILLGRTVAFEAIQLLEKIGFRDSQIMDKKFVQRAYFIKEL